MVNAKNYIAFYRCPVGWIRIKSDGRKILALEFVQKGKPGTGLHISLHPAIRQLEEYFKGSRKKFSLKLGLNGTEFQKNVWRCLNKIKFGRTISYQSVAAGSGRRRAVRAAASAVGKNRLAVVVPCHRVIASSGDLAGYAGGVWRKRWLLDHEKKRA